jgi:hypothetical protein
LSTACASRPKQEAAMTVDLLLLVILVWLLASRMR